MIRHTFGATKFTVGSSVNLLICVLRILGVSAAIGIVIHMTWHQNGLSSVARYKPLQPE